MHLKMLTFYSYHCIIEIKLELKYVQGLEKTWARKISIFKAICKQQWLIYHDFCNCLGMLNKPLIISNSKSNNNIITKQVTVNLVYLSQVVHINKQFFGLVLPANQVWFTTLIKPIAIRLNSTITIIGVGSIRDNSISFDSAIRVIPVVGANIISAMEINISSNSNYSVNSNIRLVLVVI